MAESILVKVLRDKTGALTAYWDDGKGNQSVTWYGSEAEMKEVEQLYPERISRQIALMEFMSESREYVKSIDEKHEAAAGIKATVDFTKQAFATIEAAEIPIAPVEEIKV